MPTEPPAPLACVVVNPAKRAVTASFRHDLDCRLRRAGYNTLWIPTTRQRPGAFQTRQALHLGARLVVAVGGDGTARAVAGALAGTGVIMALIPAGTANLAARNLGFPLGNRRALLDLAACGRPQPTDLAWVSTHGEDRSGLTYPAPRGGWARPVRGGEHPCLVVTGLGFDAGLVAATRPALKRSLSWGAYVAAAVTQLGGSPFSGSLEIDDAGAHQFRARCLLLANGGRLPAGIEVVPQARMDDGAIDVAAIDVVTLGRGHGQVLAGGQAAPGRAAASQRAGSANGVLASMASIPGWVDLARQILLPSLTGWRRPHLGVARTGPTARTSSHGPWASVRTARGTALRVSLPHPVPLEIDGELLAPAREVSMRMEPGALLLRRP